MNELPNISIEYNKGTFGFRNINNVRSCLRNVKFESNITSDNKFIAKIYITQEHYIELYKIEKYLEQLLKKCNSKYNLTSELQNKALLTCKLKTINNIIKTDIRDSTNQSIIYQDIPINKDLDMIISLDTMWTHVNYNKILYTYKWKIDEIKV